jgi:hypothetical protein
MLCWAEHRSFKANDFALSRSSGCCGVPRGNLKIALFRLVSIAYVAFRLFLARNWCGPANLVDRRRSRDAMASFGRASAYCRRQYRKRAIWRGGEWLAAAP